VAKRFKGLETSACPFANLPEPKNARPGMALTADVMKTCRWLKPELVAHVEFAEWTETTICGMPDLSACETIRRPRASCERRREPVSMKKNERQALRHTQYVGT
jgi:ATP dependent DNA ligase C terminal region.